MGTLDGRLALRLEALTPWLFGLVADSGWSCQYLGPTDLLMFKIGAAGIFPLETKPYNTNTTKHPSPDSLNPPCFAAIGFTDLTKVGTYLDGNLFFLASPRRVQALLWHEVAFLPSIWDSSLLRGAL